MNFASITNALDAPAALQRAAKCALAVGAHVSINSDRFHFDPDDATLHAFEMLGQARAKGFVTPSSIGPLRQRYVVRVVFSDSDVRVQIGASRWFVDKSHNTAVAMRRALVDAFCAYYDEAYPEA